MISLQEALTTGRLTEAIILTGTGGLNNSVSGVTIMDIPSIADWLTGGELVISGVLFKVCFSEEFVQSLVKKNVAGIVTKEKFTRGVQPQLLDYCDGINFPIILAPDDCNWGQIANPITEYIIRKPYLLIEESLKFHDVMMNAAIEGLSLSDVCSRMYESTGLSFAVFDNDLHIIGFSGEFDWKAYTRSMNSGNIQYGGLSFQTLDEKDVYMYSYANLLLRSVSKKLILYPVTLNHIKYGYIAIAVSVQTTKLNPIDIVKIQQMGLFVALFSTKQNEISNATRRFNGLLMDQLLSDQKFSQQQIETMLAPMEKKLHRMYYAVQLIHEELGTISSYVQRNNKIGRFHSTLDKQLDISHHILIFEKADAQILLVPSPVSDLDTLLFEIRNIFFETAGVGKLYIGISDPTPLTEIKTAFAQSQQAANYLRSSGSSKLYFFYRDLGVLRYFMDNKGNLDKQFLKSRYDKYILPLRSHDEKYNTQLLDTLELYVGNNCNKTQTEKALFIHKNTLRARLDAIGKLLDCNVDSVEDLLNLQIALKLRTLFE